MTGNYLVDWKSFWDRFPNKFARNEFLKQTGKTLHGQPISSEQLNTLVSDVVQKLKLQDIDRVMDLCCGNGLITSAIAKKCQLVIGVDFSNPLIKIAREFHSAANVSWFCMSVLDMTPENIQQSTPFTKIYMYEALQHFQQEQLAQLIETLLVFSNKETVILLASIPDQSRLWSFYNTPERQREYGEKKRQGTEAIGTWWEQSIIRDTCAAYNLQCEFLSQPKYLHTAHYRFDVRITSKLARVHPASLPEAAWQ
jgi:cyclopropane fatty-acyl-phospholipid synthase-like methyltransferase